MGEGYLFIVLLALTVATVAGVLVQVLFGLLEVKKRRLQERLGAAPESRFQSSSSYGPIAMAEKQADLTGMLAKSAMVQSFHAKLARCACRIDEAGTSGTGAGPMSGSRARFRDPQ